MRSTVGAFQSLNKVGLHIRSREAWQLHMSIGTSVEHQSMAAHLIERVRLQHQLG
jgi:hypothetical protein